MTSALARALTLFVATTLAGCSMLGREHEFSKSISTSGVGPFRTLTGPETGLDGSRVLDVEGVVHRGATAGDALFFDLEHEGARAIHRARRIGRCQGFEPIGLALAATEPWEGASVREPSALVRADGSIRVYYAADGGIGVAAAPAPDAPLAKLAPAPILAGALSTPAAVEDESLGTLLYFAEGGRIHVARSHDGVHFERLDADPATPALDPVLPLLPSDGESDADGGVDDREIAHSAPGVVVGAMPSGRRTLRLYFASERADGSLALAMAASRDGLGFERATSPILAESSVTAPHPTIDDADGHTLLFFVRRGEDTQRLHGAVSPIATRLVGHPDRGEERCDAP